MFPLKNVRSIIYLRRTASGSEVRLPRKREGPMALRCVHSAYARAIVCNETCACGWVCVCVRSHMREKPPSAAPWLQPWRDKSSRSRTQVSRGMLIRASWDPKFRNTHTHGLARRQTHTHTQIGRASCRERV